MDDLKLIKKHYGEKMSHLCRELFPTILETPGLLYKTLTERFYPTRFLYDDIIKYNYIENFKNLIYKEVDRKTSYKDSNHKKPKELLEEAGYVLYECHTYNDVKQFEKYYAKNEKLCTFADIEGRLDRCHVFFAVKKNVDEIKRENFKNPKRQDEYGTSVISIQFGKGSVNTLSIKNRYNHTVPNPDATFSNNLDNIIEGLTDAFEQEYNLNINANIVDTDLPHYVLASDGRYYKYNYETGNVYYCPDNIIVDFTLDKEVKQYDKSRYIVFDTMILDMQKKKLYPYSLYEANSFVTTIPTINSIEVTNNKEANEKTITINKSIEIVLDEQSRFIKHINPNLKVVPDDYLATSLFIKEIDLPKAKKIGDSFLEFNEEIEIVNLPNVIEIGSNFITNAYCKKLKSLILPNVETIGDYFLADNRYLEKINLNKVKRIGNYFLEDNLEIKHLYMPELLEVEDNFLYSNQLISTASFPRLRKIGDCFLYSNNRLSEINLPLVEFIGKCFLYKNTIIEEACLPIVEHIGTDFMVYNEVLRNLSLPKLHLIDKNFLRYNKFLEKIDIPSCTRIRDGFLESNIALEEINAPKVLIVTDLNWSLVANPIANQKLADILTSNNEFLRKQKQYIK